MTKKDWKRLAIAFIAIAIMAMVAAIWFAWPRSASATVPPAGQLPTATSLPTTTMVEATAATAVLTEPTSTAVPETECCKTIFVDLETSAPEGVWSNASGILIPEGWCVVLQRDQRWQQSRNEVELRQTWNQGATEDFLLLCNSGPGAQHYSLEGKFGGRPGGHEGFWNDQAKAIWVFPDPKVASCRQGTVVLYENDDPYGGWEFSIGTDGKLLFVSSTASASQPEAVVTSFLQQPQNMPVPQAQAPTGLPPQPTQQPATKPVREFSLAEDLRQVSGVQILNDRSSWDGKANGIISSVLVPEGSRVELLFQKWGPYGVWDTIEVERAVELGPGRYDLSSWEGGMFNDCLQKVVIENGSATLYENTDGSGIIITLK
jgi:hypothetical protein